MLIAQDWNEKMMSSFFRPKDVVQFNEAIDSYTYMRQCAGMYAMYTLFPVQRVVFC